VGTISPLETVFEVLSETPMKSKTLNIIRWTARGMATLFLIAFLPFYFGYGLPLPSSEMSFFENVWMLIMPLFIIGLAIGWKWEKTAGYLITLPIFAGFTISVITAQYPTFVFIFPFITGLLFLIYAYKK
jgi:hypothetical protein